MQRLSKPAALSRRRLLGAVLILSGCFGVLPASADLDVRAPVVCMRLGDAACDDEGNIGPLYWPSDPEKTAVFNPVISGAGDWSIGVAPDPAESTRRVGRLAVTSPESSATVRYIVSNRTDGRAPDETPLEFWLEGEFRYAYTGELSAGSDSLVLMNLHDRDLDRVQFRVRGGASPSLIAVNARGSILPGPVVLYSGDGLVPGRRYAIRVHWVGDPDGGNAGSLRLATVDLDSGVALHDTVIENTRNGRFFGMSFELAMVGSHLTGAESLWDRVTYSAVTAPGDLASAAAWGEQYALSPPITGAQRTMPTDPTRIELRVAAVWPGSELGDRFGAQSSAVRFQHRLLGDQEWSGGLIEHDAGAAPFGLVAQTIGGLSPLSVYQVRAVYQRDGGPARYSSVGLVRTVSAADGEPGLIRLGSYSCLDGEKMPGYAPAALARRGASEIQCLGDVAYTNANMGYNRGTEYFAYGTLAERRMEWSRLLLLQLCGPTMAQDGWANASHWIITDDHLFRDDLAGARPFNLSGENRAMILEIAGFVRDSLGQLFWPTDSAPEQRRYWWRRETSRTLSLFLECRQYADHAQRRSPSAPLDLSFSPWNGRVNDGPSALYPEDTSTWGTTVLGADQGAEMAAAVAATTKPIVIIHSPVMVSNGSQREYQDVGTYPEIWQVLRACENNARVRAVIIISGDLHLSLVVPGDRVPSPARMQALGMPLSYPKLLWEAMVGGGGQGGHRLRWQVGNEVDADSGLRGGAWDGDGQPRWEWAADYNSLWPGDETVASYDYDLYHANTWDGSGASGIGNTAKQEYAALISIDEVAMSITLEVIDLETEQVAFSRTDLVNTDPCPGDFNQDGALDTRDVLGFLGAWADDDPRADWDGNGTIDTRDFLAYLNDWVAGC